MVAPLPSSGSAAGDQTRQGSGAAHLNIDALATAVRDRRTSAGLSVRRAAEAADISFMTLSRVEAGRQPDLATFLHLCAWLRVPPDTFFITGAPRKSETPEIVATHLQTDPRLEPAAASRIAEVVRDMYNALAAKPEIPATVACHLRAAATLRPGVPERLGALLGEMQSRLLVLEAEGEL